MSTFNTANFSVDLELDLPVKITQKNIKIIEKILKEELQCIQLTNFGLKQETVGVKSATCYMNHHD